MVSERMTGSLGCARTARIVRRVVSTIRSATSVPYARERARTSIGGHVGPEIGQTYPVIIEDEAENQWTGPIGIARIGDVDIVIKNAKKGQTFQVRIAGIAVNQWTNKKQADEVLAKRARTMDSLTTVSNRPQSVSAQLSALASALK